MVKRREDAVQAAVQGVLVLFEEAAATLRLLPDRERGWLRERANWPGVLETFDDVVAQMGPRAQAPTDGTTEWQARRSMRVRPGPPSAGAVDRLALVATLYAALPGGVKPMVWGRAMGWSWEKIGRTVVPVIGRDAARARVEGALAGLLARRELWRGAGLGVGAGAGPGAGVSISRARSGSHTPPV